MGTGILQASARLIQHKTPGHDRLVSNLAAYPLRNWKMSWCNRLQQSLVFWDTGHISSPRKNMYLQKSISHIRNVTCFSVWGSTADLASCHHQEGLAGTKLTAQPHVKLQQSPRKAWSAEVPTWFCSFLWSRLHRMSNRARLVLSRSLSKYT